MVVYKFLEISDAFKLFWNQIFPRIINNCQRRASDLFVLSVILSCLIIHVWKFVHISLLEVVSYSTHCWVENLKSITVV
jgi:hypothetical protein